MPQSGNKVIYILHPHISGEKPAGGHPSASIYRHTIGSAQQTTRADIAQKTDSDVVHYALDGQKEGSTPAVDCRLRYSIATEISVLEKFHCKDDDSKHEEAMC